MPAPAGPVYSTALAVAAQTQVKNALEAGAGPAVLKLYTEADVLIATIVLADPVGTVDGTGALTLAASATVSAAAAGDITWGEFEDSDGNSVLQAPTSEGSTPVSGQIVITAASVLVGANVSIVSAVFGP